MYNYGSVIKDDKYLALSIKSTTKCEVQLSMKHKFTEDYKTSRGK